MVTTDDEMTQKFYYHGKWPEFLLLHIQSLNN